MLRSRAAQIVLAAGGLLVLAGCSAPAPEATPVPSSAVATASATPSPTATSTPETSPSSSDSPAATASGSAEDRYLGFVQQFTPTLAAQTPDRLLELGRQVCSDLAAGRAAGEVSVRLSQADVDPALEATDVAVILGASVSTLCPEYRDRLDG